MGVFECWYPENINIIKLTIRYLLFLFFLFYVDHNLFLNRLGEWYIRGIILRVGSV